ncbi:MAG TPA: hypothetical protein VIN08_20940 [Ohtaekwangia sp.]|uniref:hypothetical protein n=1 Tax=Ohtaekwangia sp. TaxID=2066019 RepID=UPI002F955658
MKSEMEKMKPIVSLFLEGLMLVFIFVYSQSSINPETQDAKDSPLKGIVSLHEVAVRSGWSSDNDSKIITQQPSLLAYIFPPVTTDAPRVLLTMSDALSVSSFERNTFYIHAAYNVP